MTELEQLSQALGRNLRRLRQERGYTLDALAARAAVSRGMIIQIEQARTNPSVGTVVKLGDALGASITSLLDLDNKPPVRIFPPDQAVRVWSTPAGSSAVLLAGAEALGPVELWHWRLMPGEASTSDPHPPGTCEIVHVTSGELTLTMDGVDYRIPAGSSATYFAHLPHAYRNEADQPAEITMAVTVPAPGG